MTNTEKNEANFKRSVVTISTTLESKAEDSARPQRYEYKPQKFS